MATGNLYSQLQSFKFDNSFAQVMESDRQRYLNGQEYLAKKKAQGYKEINDYDGNLKGDEKFFDQFLDAVEEIKKANVDDLNSMGDTPDFQRIKSKREQLIEKGVHADLEFRKWVEDMEKDHDDVLDGDDYLKILYTANNAKLSFNNKKNSLEVTFTPKGSDEPVTTTIQDYIKEVKAYQKFGKVKDPRQEAIDIGKGIKLEMLQEPLGNGRQREYTDLNNPRDLAKFEGQFESIFGSKDSGENLLVLKAMAQANGGLEPDGKDQENAWTYEYAYDYLKGEAAKQVHQVDKTNVGLKTSSGGGEANLNKELDKFSFTLLSNEGKGEKVKKQIFYKNPDGEAKDVVGLGATYDAPDTKSKFILPAKNLEGVDQGDGRGFATSNFFIDKNTLDIYVKGVAVSKDWQQKQADGEEIDISDFKTGGKEITGYKKLSPNDADMFRAKVFKGRSVKDMYNYLEGLDKKSDSVKNEKDPLGLGI